MVRGAFTFKDLTDDFRLPSTVPLWPAFVDLGGMRAFAGLFGAIR
jgi:hypothetical protein